MIKILFADDDLKYSMLLKPVGGIKKTPEN